jgi:siroheme synthase
MGVKNLPVIAGRLLAGGMPAETPLAVISNATLPGETMLYASVGEAASGKINEAVETPALVLVGSVVPGGPARHHPRF